MIVTCASCKATDHYLISDYINDLSNISGISESNDTTNNFNELRKWGIVSNSDYELINNELDYKFLIYTISNILDIKDNELVYLEDKNIIGKNIKLTSLVSKKKAIEIINRVVEIINNKEFESKYDYQYIKDIKDDKQELNIGDIVLDEVNEKYLIVDDDLKLRDAGFDEVFSYMDIEDTFTINFNDAIITPLNEEVIINYSNNKYNLLASNNHVFNSNGFRISYTINSSGIDVHVSKKFDEINTYADLSVNNVKPSFKWLYEKGDIKNCYFKLDMNTTTKLGASIGKYKNYYLKLKDLDSNDFMSSIKSMIVPKSDEAEATIEICEIKTPIPNIPFAYLNMRVGIKIYVSGKVELVIYNSHNIGFECRDGNIRYFYNHTDDVDTIASSSAKAAVAINLGLDASSFRLCDIELDGGLKAVIKPILHLYDSDFNETKQEPDIPYSTLSEISKDNSYVKLCADVSFYWLCDLIINTSKSMMYKFGLTKTIHIMDEDNQVFNNLHHMEDGKFVKKCTRTSKPLIKNADLNVNSNNKIVLNTYAEVLLVNQEFKIEVISLPNNYDIKDIRYTSLDPSIVSVNGNTIKPLKVGNTKIHVHSSDNKYNSYINILVSTG